MSFDTGRWAVRVRRPEVFTGVIVLLLLLVMELGVREGYIDPLVLQQPTVVFDQLVTNLQGGELQVDIIATAQRVAIASVLSILGGSVISVVLWRYETLRRAYLPLLSAVFATPIPLAYLVFVVLLGRGSAAIVAISLPVGAIPIVINATDALATVDEVKIKVADSFNASGYQVLLKVILPDAAPDIFTGIRIGFTYIIISVTAIEFLLVTNRGLGGYISDAYFKFNTVNMFVGITLVICIVVVAIFILQRLEEVIRR